VTIIDAITQARHRRSARREYARLDVTADDLGARLYTLTAPAERAALLTTWAETLTAMAIAHHATGKTATKNTRFQLPESEVAATLSARAHLLRLAAASEWMLTLAEAHRELDDLLTEIPPTEARVWLNLAHNPNRADRAELLTHAAEMASERLGTYAGQRFGEQAAEVLNDVADAERELAAGRIAPIASQSAARWGSVALFASGAAMIAVPMIPGFNHWPNSAQALADLGGPGLLAAIAGGIWRHRTRANRRLIRSAQAAQTDQEVGEEAMPSQ
jgi:hypothetical protein